MIEEVQFYPCRDVYEEGMALLAGLEDAALDARLLLEHFCGIDTNRLLAEPGMPVSDDLRSAFLKGIKRRGAARLYSRGAVLYGTSLYRV